MGTKLIGGTGILLVYMLPSLLVVGGQLWEYHYRICDEWKRLDSNPIVLQLMDEVTDRNAAAGKEEFFADGRLSREERQEIVRRFRAAQREYEKDPDRETRLQRYQKDAAPVNYCVKIWRENSIIIAIMVFLPFLLFAMRLAYDPRLDCTTRERFMLAAENWPMKLIVAGVIGVGWMYLLNPYGRAATTFYQTYLLNSVPPVNTMPIYISMPDVSHTVAGFLGWYLNFLFYVFTKLYHNDVTSSRMYRFLFVKLLFTYGLAMVATPVMETEGKLAMFLIGFFPVSAAMFVRRLAARALQNAETDSDDLSVLPGMSTWTTLRLQEEGVNSITTLASLRIAEVRRYFPVRITNLLRLWIDAARLHTAIGASAYRKLMPLCQTATEFIELSTTEDFSQKLKALTEIESAETVVNRIQNTFPDDLFLSTPSSMASPSTR